MSFTARFEPPQTGEFDVDLTPCETCKHKNYNFECGQIGYCITDCGEGYVISSILHEKGYGQCNTEWANINGVLTEGLELYNEECKKLMKNLRELGYNSILCHAPLQKKYLSTVIIDNYRPIELCDVFMKLEAIK